MAEVLIDIWLRDIDLGNAVAGLPWVADRVSEEEAMVLHSLRNIADTDQELAKQIVELSWLADRLSDNEWRALYSLGRIASKDMELAKLVAGFAWFTDGIIDDVPSTERLALETLENIASNDIQLANLAVEFAWFSDGITSDEWGALSSLGFVASKDVGLATVVANFPWLADDVTGAERGAVHALAVFASYNVEMARAAAGLPWFRDGITSVEQDTLNDLGFITSKDAALARSLLPWFADGPERDLHSYVPRSLAHLARIGEDVLGQLTVQPWSADGLDDEEAALVVTLDWVASRSPRLYADLLSNHFTQYRAVYLPMAGDVDIWVFQDTPFPVDEDLLTIIEDTARITEGFLGVPFPTTDIILLVADEEERLHGWHAGTHMTLTRKSGSVRSLPHETAHYYFSKGPQWLREGGSEFIETYVKDRTGLQSISDRKAEVSQRAQSQCLDLNEIENIRHYVYLHGSTAGATGQCVYYMGENFLLNVFETIGEVAMASALRELYPLVLDRERYEWRDEREEEDLIFNTLVKHVPTERWEEFRDLYRRLHGGPYEDPGVDYLDDHGDEAAAATEIAVGEMAEGSLDYHFDFDYFKFRAEEGQRYVIKINHETLRPSSLLLYGPDGQTRARYLDRARVSSGPQMRWIAPASGDYYFAVQNFSGESGPYTTTITSIAAVPDDHGDSAAAATDIPVGEIVEGTIDHNFDFDFFRVQVEAGQRYRFHTQGVTLAFSRVDLYESDGVTWTEQSAESFLNEEEQGETSVWGGGDGVWGAPSSGEYYLAAQGVYGNVGIYRLIVSEADSGRVDLRP